MMIIMDDFDEDNNDDTTADKDNDGNAQQAKIDYITMAWQLLLLLFVLQLQVIQVLIMMR